VALGGLDIAERRRFPFVETVQGARCATGGFRDNYRIPSIPCYYYFDLFITVIAIVERRIGRRGRTSLFGRTN